MRIGLGLRACVLAGLLLATHAALLAAGEAEQPRDEAALPRSLLDTGLYQAGSTTEIRPPGWGPGA